MNNTHTRTHTRVPADLQGMGLQSDALELLYAFVCPPRRTARAWSRYWQDVMCIFVDLCLALRENADNMKKLKDAMHQYRSLTQQVRPRVPAGHESRIIPYLVQIFDAFVA